ncbi:MAG: preprotein translocase subunit SecG [Hydrogenophaga sp.]|uniref:preprotein translocase subunit SecG n=1 Tax=Hydrogenophaga sp. TaxID=1904254 RepID=UPI0016A8D974|nr:preprotein translocase subunit SecG [Hydrogenophaga sp.]NIM41318.1 preprotein translocase subunit SecG [Hydrogenophaga sp.]NIN26634.1 preprotein translocase subunit SecG [Hydrogenophaga sp.]NIN29956.1 preprotein translocase subunit SecG [Hydrogenophaga sp.]NIN55564.1 preprotein translocase subunit SecG [Hydrogenophaga sp.]NIO52561.1 preprotein translocase subunit SecG [Hydrogenophaga sp.]
MNVLLTLLLVVQILAALGMIGLILMQHGKGADAGAAFGGGGAGSASLFGASGGANFLSRTTAVLAGVFLACTLGLAYFGNLRTAAPSSGSVLENVPAAPASPVQQIPGGATAPAAPGATPAPASTPAPTGAGQIPAQ